MSVLTLTAAACGSAGDGSENEGATLDVVAAFYPLAEAARQVGGDLADVDDLTPAGAEPHDLELTTRQADAIEDADVVLVMGRDFQPALETFADRRDDGMVAVLDELSIDLPERDEEIDPHVWLDPRLMKEIVTVVQSALAAAKPERAREFADNATRYRTELDALDAAYGAGLANCVRDEIVTAHEAFGWLARRYGFEQYAIAGVEPDEEPSADRIAELADLVERNGVTTIFTETLVSPDVAETLAREAGGVATATLDPLESLDDDARERGDDYVSVMVENLEVLRTALGCAP